MTSYLHEGTDMGVRSGFSTGENSSLINKIDHKYNTGL